MKWVQILNQTIYSVQVWFGFKPCTPLERSDEHLPMKFESLGGEKFADEYDEDGGEKLKKKIAVYYIVCF